MQFVIQGLQFWLNEFTKYPIAVQLTLHIPFSYKNVPVVHDEQYFSDKQVTQGKEHSEHFIVLLFL